MLRIPQHLRQRLNRLLSQPPSTLAYVNIAAQQLVLRRNGRTIATYPVSTSALGAGNREGSNQTPLGIHRIRDRIGAGAPAGRMFRGRVDAGETWTGVPTGDDLILSRILRLEGMEEGVNRGPGIDSYERYIYIHGTNHEDAVGTAASHGCVRMRNADVIDLFEKVNEDTIVVIG
jgi:lipoprotein-anchoring transpeptidase ErfK/SrfK